MSKIEDELEFQLKVTGIKGFVREYRFHPTILWRADFCNVKERLMIEVEGGVFMKKSGHTTGVGYTKNCVKYNEALILGWRVLRVTTAQVKSGEALMWIERALEAGKSQA